MLLVQKTFGEFVSDRFGPKWVYACRRTDRLSAQYPGSVVITPKAQKELRDDYRRVWGREYDPEFWAMLCALRAIRDHAAARDNCLATIEALANAALEVATK
jgi:hypothetical protein